MTLRMRFWREPEACSNVLTVGLLKPSNIQSLLGCKHSCTQVSVKVGGRGVLQGRAQLKQSLQGCG